MRVCVERPCFTRHAGGSFPELFAQFLGAFLRREQGLFELGFHARFVHRRERVTSKGGTTYAALTSLESDRVQQSFVKALHAACKRAAELGDEFGR